MGENTMAVSISRRAIPASVEEELLLTVPNKLQKLTKDEFWMVRLTRENADMVEACIKEDPAYQSHGKAVMEQHFCAGNYSNEAYYDIIDCIATENSTHTSNEAKKCLAGYCAALENRFLDRIREGDPYLVDDLLQQLVQNGYRKEKSLASKICRYLNEWLYGGCAYTINDSVVRTILPYYLAYYKIDRTLWQGKLFDKLSYMAFYEIFSTVRDAVGELNNHQLDHLIWYAYKNDSIRRELAKALSKIL